MHHFSVRRQKVTSNDAQYDMKAKPFEKLLLQQMEIFDQFDKLSIAGNADAGGQIHPEQTLKAPWL